jgi:arylsulfatase A-like enzyme
MNLNMKINILAFLLLTALNSSLLWGQAISEKPVNILCILVDDLGYGDLSCMGAEDMKTPHIDQLAEQGITFTQFYANCTVCSPSRASLLSGKYPDLVGVPGVIRQFEDNSWGYLDPEVTLLPSLLKQGVHHTAMVGKWHLGFESPNIPNDRGFDYFKGFLGDMMDDYWTHLRGGINWMRMNKEVINPEGHATDLFTQWSLDYLKERHQDQKPFFLYLAYNAPHFPIQPPEEFLSKVKKREPGLSEKRAKNVAFIEHLDHNVGRVLDFLKESGLDENTLVVFTSDNGGALRYEQSNGKLRGGKQDMYEGGIRVPAFISWKGKIEKGRTSHQPALLMDLLPTFCDLAGVEVPDEVDGISLLSLILEKNQVLPERYLYWVRREGGSYGGQAYYAARLADYKILQNTPYEPFQFFNVGADPYETTPLDPSESEVYNKLRLQLQMHIQRSGKIPWQE